MPDLRNVQKEEHWLLCSSF